MVVRFIDSGHGVQHPEHLFKPFQTGAQATGLGLYLIKSIVEHIGGKISFVSEEDKGTTFYVKLPIGQHQLT